ncbi:hypothetical protein GIB67_008978, partial [Kingdonia uniflora]
YFVTVAVVGPVIVAARTNHCAVLSGELAACPIISRPCAAMVKVCLLGCVESILEACLGSKLRLQMIFGRLVLRIEWVSRYSSRLRSSLRVSEWGRRLRVGYYNFINYQHAPFVFLLDGLSQLYVSVSTITEVSVQETAFGDQTQTVKEIAFGDQTQTVELNGSLVGCIVNMTEYKNISVTAPYIKCDTHI